MKEQLIKGSACQTINLSSRLLGITKVFPKPEMTYSDLYFKRSILIAVVAR
jgi:hypothetical protein